MAVVHVPELASERAENGRGIGFTAPTEAAAYTERWPWQASQVKDKQQEVFPKLLVKCACGAEAYVSAQFAGKRGKCKVCGEPVVVPEAEGVAA
jgi:hypothetical protein